MSLDDCVGCWPVTGSQAQQLAFLITRQCSYLACTKRRDLDKLSNSDQPGAHDRLCGTGV